MGIEYIRKLKEVVDPFIVPGGSREMRDAVLLGQFPLGFSGRPEFLTDVPKGSPLAYIVPQEGVTWLPHSTALIKNAPHPDAPLVGPDSGAHGLAAVDDAGDRPWPGFALGLDISSPADQSLRDLDDRDSGLRREWLAARHPHHAISHHAGE